MSNTNYAQSSTPMEISFKNIYINPIKNNQPLIHSNFDKNPIESIEIEQRIPIKNKGVLFFIPTLDIILIAAESNYSNIFLCDGSKIMTSKTLKHWFDKIGGDHMVRVHRSYLVNKNHARSLHLNEKLLILSNGMVVTLSRRNCKDKVDSLIKA